MTPKKKSLISIVVPCYNDEKNLTPLYKQLDKILLSDDTYSFQLVLVNDWSHDKTWEWIKKLSESDKRIIWLNLSRNFGHQWALTAWLEKATWEAIISMDSDLQDPVEVARDMIIEWEKWFEVVYARRTDRNDSFLKNQTAILYYKILSLISDTRIPRNVGDFRLIDKKVLKAFLRLKEKDRYIRGMFAWLGFKTWYVDFVRPERTQWQSWYTLRKLFQLAMDGVLSFSMFPLRIWFIIWIIMIILSLIFSTFMATQVIISWDIYLYQLYKWISVIGFWVMGLQFIFIWILWEYIWRIYNETRERPVYIISDTVNIK